MSKSAEVYVDGSFKDGIVGVGVVFKMGDEIRDFAFSLVSDKISAHRNVSGETYAVMYAIFYAYKISIEQLGIFHDYSGLAHWISGEWKAKTELTKLYRDFVKYFSSLINIEFVKVAAHKKDVLNNRADRLAKEALDGKNTVMYFNEFTEFLSKFNN